MMMMMMMTLMKRRPVKDTQPGHSLPHQLVHRHCHLLNLLKIIMLASSCSSDCARASMAWDLWLPMRTRLVGCVVVHGTRMSTSMKHTKLLIMVHA